MIRRNLAERKRVVLSAAVMVVTIAGLVFWFAGEIESNLKSKVDTRLSSASSTLRHSFADIFMHTEFLMRNINANIKTKPDDLKHIESIIDKYRVNVDKNNALSWTIFSWANSNDMITVDAVYGIMKHPYDLSSRDYLVFNKVYPDRLVLGKPVLGSTSKRWMIPGGVGLKDGEKYLGSLTIGFDLNSVAAQVAQSIKDQNVRYYVFDSRMNLLVDSTKLKQGPENYAPKEVSARVSSYIKNRKNKQVTLVDVIGQENYQISKFEDLPFYIYVSYAPEALRVEFWESITSRIVELIIMGIIAILLVIYIYRRESALRKKAEDNYQLALAASKGKTEFLAYTGHELRSPLNVIIFGSEMMKSKVFGEMPPKYLEYAEDIYQNGNDLLHFIEDLMDVTKADEEGAFTLRPEYVDVAEIVERVVRLNLARATKHKIRIEKIIPADLPKLWADSRRLRQILNNLMSNAIKYSMENTTVKIIAHAIDGAMQIIIEDEGFGMTEEQVEIAMQRYGTVNNQHTGKVESIGLGLPLVKQLVDAHKGKFDIESKPGKGTTVTLTFKLSEHKI